MEQMTMARRFSGPIVGMALVAAATFSPALADEPALDPLLTRIVQDLDRHTDEGWAYTLDVNVRAMGEVEQVTKRYDPSRPEGERVTVLRSSDDDREAGDTKGDFDNDLPGYADLRGLLENGAELISETDDIATYRVERGEGGKMNFGHLDIDLGDEDVGGDVDATLTVVKSGRFAPYVSQVSMKLDKPKGTMLLARVNDFALNYGFKPQGEAGVMLLDAFHLTLDMRTLVFIHVDIDVDVKARDYAFVGAPKG